MKTAMKRSRSWLPKMCHIKHTPESGIVLAEAAAKMTVFRQLFRNFYEDQNTFHSYLENCFCLRVPDGEDEEGEGFRSGLHKFRGSPDGARCVKQVKEICFDALKCMQISLK